MRVADIVAYLDGLLMPEAFPKDPSLNGLQVGDATADATRVAFAVDACMASFERARSSGAGMIVVHHGLFWGQPAPLVGYRFQRVAYLAREGLALYASHLPLDRHPELGNNAVLARRLGLEGLEPFGESKGSKIGYKGILPEPMGLDAIRRRLFPESGAPQAALPFGPELIRSVGIVSGGASRNLDDAISEGLDLFVTGEMSHEAYHAALEARVSMFCAGHYQTEIWGVREISVWMGADLGLECFFIDVPSGY